MEPSTSGEQRAETTAPSPEPREGQPLTVAQAAGIVIRHLVPVYGVLFLGWSAQQFLLMSIFNIAFSIACIGTISVAVSRQQKGTATHGAAGSIRSWISLLAGALLVTLILTAALGWWILVISPRGGPPLLVRSLAWAALSMIVSAAPGLLRQYRSDLHSTLSAKQRRERDQANGMLLFVCGVLIFMMANTILPLTVIGATALFIVRDLRPGLLRQLMQGKGGRPQRRRH
jgi:hypothetical protein